MKRLSIALSAVLAAAVAPADEYLDPKGLGFDPFVPFDALPKDELYPQDAAFSVSKEGHLLVNGQPHYFPATIWYGATELECNEDTPGYVPELKWLYQDMPGYDNLQRLGLDGIGYEAPMEWMLKLNPKQRMRRRDDKKYAAAIASTLPVYVDFTAANWGHGCLSCNEKARAPGGHHFMPYSILTDEGRKVWLTMWEEGARLTREIGWKPWCYELMNEPACSEEGRVDQSLKGADRIKAIEEKFASLLAEGQEAIRRVDPNALACFQPTTMRTRGIDLYTANKPLGVVCAPTGGHGGAVEAHLLRALADGKPIVDSEMYVGCSTNSIRQSFLDQYQRGYNVSYMFKWSRRPSDWRAAHEVVETEGKWKGTKFWRMWPEESLKKVGKVSAYNFLCPYKVNTDQLLGIRLAKREIQDVNEFFTPRDRGVPRKVAVLFSQTNERHAFANGGGNHRLFDALVQALEYAHLPIDVIFEPQINETDRLNRYDVLTFAGIAAMDPVTRSRIDEWAAKGGSLVEFKEKVATSEMVSAVLAAAAKKGVNPCCEMLDAIKDDGSAAASIEVTPARRGKLDAYMITSRAPTLPVVRFKPAPLPGGAKKPILVRLFTRPDDKSVAGADPRVRNLVSHRQPLKPDADGYYTLVLSGGSHFYVYGDVSDVLAKYPRSSDAVWDQGLTAEKSLELGKAEIARERAERVARQPVFDVDPNRMVFVRLNEFANVQNPDFKIPWGVTDWRGMRFDFIRFDQNQFKDVIKVEKPVKGIAVDSRAAFLYFAHTAAPVYRVVYDDKTSVEVDAKSGQEVVGWKDGEGHKYMIRQWPNPKPEKKIASVEIAPRRGTTSYVAAITVQKPEPKVVEFPKIGRSGGGKGVHASYDEATRTWNVALDETAGSWCCGNADLAEGIPVEPGKYTRLYFEMNRLPDADGNYHDHATPQLKLNGRDENGKLAFGGWRVPMYKRGGWAYRADNDPETWETVWIGIDKGTVPEHFRKIISIAVQFQMMPAEHSGLAFRNFRLEEAE